MKTVLSIVTLFLTVVGVNADDCRVNRGPTQTVRVIRYVQPQPQPIQVVREEVVQEEECPQPPPVASQGFYGSVGSSHSYGTGYSVGYSQFSSQGSGYSNGGNQFRGDRAYYAGSVGNHHFSGGGHFVRGDLPIAPNTTIVKTRSTGLRRFFGGGDTEVTTTSGGFSGAPGGNGNQGRVKITPTFFRGNKVEVN